MSLKEINPKYRADLIEKKVTILATEDDLKALKDVIDETERMFSPDLVRDGDLPPRITISEDVDPEAEMYPRTASLLRSFSKALDVSAGGTSRYVNVIVSPLPILHVRGTHSGEVLGLMETVLHGKNLNKGKLDKKHLTSLSTDYKNVVGSLDGPIGLIKYQQLRNALTNADLQWAYVQNLDTHMGAHMTPNQKQSIKKMLEADKLKKDYPMNAGSYSQTYINGVPYTQAYIAMLRSNDALSLDIPTHIKKSDWESFLRDYGIAGSELSKEYRKPPRTLKDVLEFLFAYSVGQTFRCENTLVVPFGEGRTTIQRELIKGQGKIDDGVDEIEGYKHLYKAIVVGTGPIHIAPNVLKDNHGSVSALKINKVPGFFM